MKEIEIDANSMVPRDLNRAVKQAARKYDRIIIKNPNAMHYMVAGLTDDVEILIDGSAGYFAGTMIDGAKIHITGNAGWFPADNMTDGEVIIDGTAGDGVGPVSYTHLTLPTKA